MVGRPGTSTILFTDLVGSTERRVALGEDAADRHRQAHDRVLAAIVATHGGTLVKGTGDGIMATFPSAAAAVLGAVAMQQAATAALDDGTPRAEVRIGISAGDVTWDEDDCFGTPVIEAARLCAAAAGGQILVADVVRILARGRHGHTLTALGSLDLKGLPEPVVTHEVEWAPAVGAGDDARVPLPAALRGDREFPFAGRGGELARLRDAWSCAERGERRCAVVSGEPGIGKTRLAAQIAAEAYDAGGLVLYGRCDEDVGSPYQPFAEALGYFVHNTAMDELLAQLGTHAGDLARLRPDLPGLVPDLPAPLQSEPEAERHRLFEA